MDGDTGELLVASGQTRFGSWAFYDCPPARSGDVAQRFEYQHGTGRTRTGGTRPALAEGERLSITLDESVNCAFLSIRCAASVDAVTFEFTDGRTTTQDTSVPSPLSGDRFLVLELQADETVTSCWPVPATGESFVCPQRRQSAPHPR